MISRIIFTFGILFILIILLIFIKKLLRKKIKRPELVAGTAQTLGARDEQEDSFSIIENESGLMAVLADGMGGFSSGERASKLAVKTFLEEFTRQYDISSIKDFLINTTYLSNYNIVKSAKGENMGTTLAVALIREGYFYWVSVGDSQIYLYSKKGLHEINIKHTFAIRLNEACRKGEISRQIARTHPKRDRLISYLGDKNFHMLDYSKNPIKLNKGEKVLICSDGIYNNISKLELEEILSKKRLKSDRAAEIILDRVLSRNAANQDNATVLVIEKIY